VTHASRPSGTDAHHVYFYNVTNVIPCIDFDRSATEGKKVIMPAFVASALPTGAQVFKDPLRKKMDIYLTDGAHAELTARIACAGLRGSTFKPVG
jgi:hypothetical protein